MKLPLLCLLLLALTGCATAPAGSGVKVWNPITWFSRAEATASDRAEAKLATARTAEEEAREALLRTAQRTAHETAFALLSAPASRPVEVATEAAEATADGLDQAIGALPAETRAAIRAQVSALLSDNAALRAEGETLRATARDIANTASRELTEAARRTTAAEAVSASARADLRSAYDRENALANELRNERTLKWLASAASVAATIAALAYRANAFGLADGVARGLADLRTKQPGVADLATGALDAGLNRTEQSAIAKRVQALLAISRP